MRYSKLSPCRTALIAAFFAAGLIQGCKPGGASKSKSFVGLNADVNEDIAKGAAPSYLALQAWFKGNYQVNDAEAQAGGIRYKVNAEFNDDVYSQMPVAYREGMVKYFQQQIVRVAEFQRFEKNPIELKNLLALESAEMYDIIRGLAEVGYTPVHNDLFAQLVKQPNLRNYVDRFSLPFLKEISKRSLRDVIANLGVERDNFTQLLIKANLDQNGATAKFSASLKQNCATLKDLISLLGSTPANDCQASDSLHLGSSSKSIASTVSQVDGGGRVFANMYGGMFAPRGFGSVASSSASPNLSIFKGKDVNVGDVGKGGAVTPSSNNTDSSSVNNNSTTPASDPFGLGQLIGPNWANLFNTSNSNSNGSMGLNEEGSEMMLASTAKNLPSAPQFNCVERGFTGLALVQCQRYFSRMPKLSSIRQNLAQLASDSSSYQSNSSLQLNSVGSYNYAIVANYSTPVQNQGQEGACTAFGFAHTVEANLKVLGISTSVNAQEIWTAQGQQPYMESALSAGKAKSFNGRSIKSTRLLNTIQEAKAAISQGRAVYAASNIAGDWYGPRGGALTCGDVNAAYGHAYSLQGYDEEKQVFIIKNSWGDSWGEEGYYYLPYRCIESQGYSNSLYDIQF